MEPVKSNPNQEVLIVTEDPVMDGSHPYRKLSLRAIENALSLSPNTFKLYMYIAKNAVGYKLALSPTAIKNMTGMSSDTYRKSKQELIDSKYLIPVSKRLYMFYQNPHLEAISSEEEAVISME